MSDLQVLNINPTVKTTAYTAGKTIGAAAELTKAFMSTGRALLKNVTVTEVGTQKAPLTIILFNATPGTVADDATPSLASLAASIVGKINVLTTDYETVGGVSIANVDLSRVIRSASGSKSLWYMIVGTGTPTFASASALRLALGLMRDE